MYFRFNKKFYLIANHSMTHIYLLPDFDFLLPFTTIFSLS